MNIEFDYNDCLAAIDKIIDNVTHYIDFLPSGDVVFQAPDETTADHVLTFEKHITEYESEIESVVMVNDVFVSYSGGTVTDSDVDSQSDY